MASNSPGTFSRSHQDSEGQDRYVIPGLIPDVNLPGQFHLSMDSGYHGDVGFIRESGYYVSTSDGASTCSSSTAETWESDGAALLVLESKSLRSFTTNDEYLFAMKEDLADWFSSLYQNYDITVGNLFQVLETGVLLCKHANKVQEIARQSREIGEVLEMKSYFIRSVPEGNVPYREGVKPETFQARDNVSNFITWTRELGIPQVLSFETDDLVLRKNEKSVILSLLEVARVGAKLGMLAPTLVQMEQEIDAELAGEEPPPQVQIKTCDLRSLDERVRDLIGRCTCPVQFPMIKVGEGKYKIGDTRSLIFVRILRNHVMVRVGGGWDTLENYLNKHDPCQCQYRGHRAGTPRDVHKVAANQQRRSSNPSHMGVCSTLNTPTPQRQGSPVTTTSRNRSASPQTSSRTSSPTSSVASHNIPTPAKSAVITITSSKGACVAPSHNQQEAAAGSLPHQFPSSSNSISTSHPIRSSSPRLSQHKASSPLRSAQSTTLPISSLQTPSSSAVLKGKDQHKGNKILVPKKETVSFLHRSASLEDQAASYSENHSSPLHHQLTLEVPTAPKVASGKSSSEEVARRKSLSQFSEAEKIGRSGAHTDSPSNSDVARIPISHPKGQSSLAKAPKSRSGYGQKISSSLDINTGKENKKEISELADHLKRDAVPDVTCAISDWLESTIEMDARNQIADQANRPARSTTAVESCSSTAQNLIGKNTDTVGSQHVQTSTSTIRDRPATSSRIPKPRKTSHPATPRIASTDYVCSPKSDIDSYRPQSLKDLHLDQTCISDASEKTPSCLSDVSVKTPSDLSTSNSETHLAPNRNIFHDEGIRAETVKTQAGEPDIVSDMCSTTSNNNSSLYYNDCLTAGKAAILEADGSNPAVTSTHRKLSVGSREPSFSTFGNRDLSPSCQRRSSVDAKPQTNSLENVSWFHRASSTSNLDSERPKLIINDITFSDDEEINGLIKNSGLKEKASNRNMHSPSVHARRVSHQKGKKNEEILMVSRDGAGHHVVQLTKNELKLNSAPKSTVTRRTHGGFKDSHPGRSDLSHNFKTPNPIKVPKKISPKGPASSKSIRKLESPCKQAKDLGNEVLATDLSSNPLAKTLADSKNGFFQADADTIHSPKEDLEMFKNMEKLFQKYREMELKAVVTDLSGRESGKAPSEKSEDT